MIESLAGASAEDLRATTRSDLDAGLADLQVRAAAHRRRTQVRLVAAAAAIAVALTGIGGAIAAHRDRHLSPSKPTPRENTSGSWCPTAVRVVQCLGQGRFGFALKRPVVWRVPIPFGVGSSHDLPWWVESYWIPDESMAGVTVMEEVRAASPDGSAPAAGVADGPRALVHWIASRPFVSAGPVQTTTIDGHVAWQVRVRLAPRSGRCSGGNRSSSRPAPGGGWSCYPLTYEPDGLSAGLSRQESSQYTAFELPGAGTTVVWSWVYRSTEVPIRSQAQPPRLSTLDQAVKALSWPDR